MQQAIPVGELRKPSPAAAAPAYAAELADIETLLSLYRPRVFRFILLSVRDEDVANTLTQDCFLKAYDARAQFRGDSKVSTWLMQIAANLTRDYARSRKLQFWRRAAQGPSILEITEYLPDQRSSAEAQAIAVAQVRLVWQAVGGLTAKQRSVFLLRFVDEMQLSEIAETTGLQIGTVKSHLYRAVQVVRSKIQAAESGDRE